MMDYCILKTVKINKRKKMEIEQIKNEILKFLEPIKESGLNSYDWRVNEKIFSEYFILKDLPKKNHIEMNIWLRKYLNKKINNSKNINEKIKIAEYYINKWGGITGFKSHKKIVDKYDEKIISDESPYKEYEFENISSWSKYLSIAYPKWAVIYDSRVAYSLNSIILINNIKSKIFPMPTSRNKNITLLDIETILLTKKIKNNQDEEYKSIKEKYFYDPKKVYNNYLELMKLLAIELYGNKEDIIKVEMLLFSIADEFMVNKVIDYIRIENN